MKLSDIFEEKPQYWGYRGDPYFWAYLKEKADNTEISSAEELESWIKKEHFSVSGIELTDRSVAVVEQFAHGGMSSGGVDGGWWTETGIPLLKSRFKAANIGLRIFETELDGGALGELIKMSEDWEAENSCYGYRANERADIEGNRIFFANDGEKTVGYLFGHIEKSENMTSIMPEDTPFFEVEEIYVIPEKRCRGIGEKLFRYAENAVKNEAEYMVLSTATKNWKAIFHFYLDELEMTFWSARLFKKIK